MIKTMKFIVGFVAATFIIIAVFLGSFVYVSNYKITKADTSVSPDGTYELVLQAVGEAAFPFGSASGRVVLYEGKSRISKADFELRDDGRNIRSSIWEVTWHEDSVEVILSGDEQLNEQIILYFDGKKERKQLTNEEPVNESGMANSQIKGSQILILWNTAVIGLVRERHMNRFWPKEEWNYPAQLQEIINFREHFFHNRK